MSRFIIAFALLWVAVLYFPQQTKAVGTAVHDRLSGVIDSVWAAKPYAGKP